MVRSLINLSGLFIIRRTDYKECAVLSWSTIVFSTANRDISGHLLTEFTLRRIRSRTGQNQRAAFLNRGEIGITSLRRDDLRSQTAGDRDRTAIEFNGVEREIVIDGNACLGDNLIRHNTDVVVVTFITEFE